MRVCARSLAPERARVVDERARLCAFGWAGFNAAHPCARCCELFRVHGVVRMMMKSNGTTAAGDTETPASPIPPDKVLGFVSEISQDKYLMQNPEFVQGGFIFSSPHANSTTFMVQHNSTPSQKRGTWTQPVMVTTIPMQITASKAIATQIIRSADPGSEPGFEDLLLHMQPFAHPPQQIASFEATIAPLFLVACAMFPFVVQIGEVVAERELKLRQALAAMGLHDLSYWLSWHIYQSAMALLNAFLTYCFGCMFQFKIFLKNDFGVVLLTFWLHGQALVGFAFFTATLLSRSTQAVAMGFAAFLVGFVLFFMVGLFEFPFGNLDTTPPFAYESNITDGSLYWKGDSETLVAPIIAILPPALLVQDINVLGAFTASDEDVGLRFRNASNYCTLERNCDPSYSIGGSWSVFIGLYVLYSLLALYLDNVLPDAMGVRKPLWYFLTPSYWGLGDPNVADAVQVIEPSTDEDVLAEEARMQDRANAPPRADCAIEIRGLIAEFRRGGKPFFAVKAPWYAVPKTHLLALLGPNGAGKTTTVNMLTGFIPPSRGNALVTGCTVAHPVGMSRVRRRMGVCPQFDTLWSALTAREHLELFAAIKGVNKIAIPNEAMRLIEQVRLTDAADRTAGTYSGGMRRRLSVAIALIGDPQVVFLDEPTTGMDPINRRHVWDVVEAAKQDRCVVLTTHSMEEADILGDTIAIMAKGRLRCLGSTVRLKTRFGAGYKISISLGDKTDEDTAQSRALRELMSRHLAVAPEADASKTYVHFNVPANSEEKLAQLFAELEERRAEIGIVDVQLAMSTLEDVFLKIAKDSEVEEATKDNVRTTVTLSNNEQVQVLVGSEEPAVSPGGIGYKVVWNTDEDGKLVVDETIEDEARAVTATAPADATRMVSVEVDGNYHNVEVPEGVAPGTKFTATVRVARNGHQLQAVPSSLGDDLISAEQVAVRMQKLKTPYLTQANALFRKNLSFQKKRRLTNCCLVIVPILVLCLILGVQLIVEILFLAQPRVRCPYCGPADDAYGKIYCANFASCQSFFFPNESRAEYKNRFRVDVVEECAAMARTCGGNGNTSCFKREWAQGFQIAFCPFETAPSQPSFAYMPPPLLASKTPVLYTSDAPAGNGKGDPAAADNVVKKMYDVSAQDEGFKKLQGTMDYAMSQMFHLLVAVPLVGCADLDVKSQMTARDEAAVCKLLQYGQGYQARPCCVDLTDRGVDDARNRGLGTDAFTGELVAGLNYWSATPLQHNDTIYNATMAACLQGGAARATCNRQVMTVWGAEGVQFGSGFGKASILLMIQRVLGGAAPAIAGISIENVAASLGVGNPTGIATMFAALYTDVSEFRCVAPAFPEAVTAHMEAGGYAMGAEAAQGDKCVNLHEGLAIVAKYAGFSQALYPPPEPADIPECSAAGTCQTKSGTFLGKTQYLKGGGRWAQACDLYTQDALAILQTAMQGGQLAALIAVNQIPCTCRWLLFAEQLTTQVLFPSGPLAQVQNTMPRMYNCPKNPATGEYKCNALSVYEPLSIPELHLTTQAFATNSFYYERALEKRRWSWWNEEHVVDKGGYDAHEGYLRELAEGPPRDTCEDRQSCWRRWRRNGGNVSFVTNDCAAFAGGACFLQRLGNISGLEVGCLRYVCGNDHLNGMFCHVPWSLLTLALCVHVYLNVCLADQRYEFAARGQRTVGRAHLRRLLQPLQGRRRRAGGVFERLRPRQY